MAAWIERQHWAVRLPARFFRTTTDTYGRWFSVPLIVSGLATVWTFFHIPLPWLPATMPQWANQVISTLTPWGFGTTIVGVVLYGFARTGYEVGISTESTTTVRDERVKTPEHITEPISVLDKVNGAGRNYEELFLLMGLEQHIPNSPIWKSRDRLRELGPIIAKLDEKVKTKPYNQRRARRLLHSTGPGMVFGARVVEVLKDEISPTIESEWYVDEGMLRLGALAIRRVKYYEEASEVIENAV